MFSFYKSLPSDALEKLAKLKETVSLYPHQQKIVDDKSNSKIIAHSVGGGKTLTSIAKFEKMRENGEAKKALVVVPASLRNNFGEEGVSKFTSSKYNIIGNKEEQRRGVFNKVDPNADYNIISYEMYRKDPARYLRESGADTVISDEAHRGKNEDTSTSKEMLKARPLYKNHLALTGSAVSNTVGDIQPLIKLVSNNQADVGRDKKEFEKRFVKRSKSQIYDGISENRKPIVGFNDSKNLKKTLNQYVDYKGYDELKDVADLPTKKVKVEKVPITKEQARAYRKVLKDDPAMMKLIKEKRLETLKNEEAASAFSKLVEQRKLMNSVGTIYPGMSLSESIEKTPKTNKLLTDLDEYLKNTPDGQALVMSHLITGGADVLEQGLKDRDISYGKFLGKGNEGITEESRQKAVKDFNNRKNRVMIVSPAGGEGLSLNDTTYEAVLDPHFNPEKMNQMEARGIRSGGLKNRPDRSVEVNRYISTMPKTLGIFKSQYRTPDEFIYEIAQNKDKQNKVFYDFMNK